MLDKILYEDDSNESINTTVSFIIIFVNRYDN
jgi:hypothetical protein